MSSVGSRHPDYNNCRNRKPIFSGKVHCKRPKPKYFLIFLFGRKKPLSLKTMAPSSSRDRLRAAALSEKRFKSKAKHVNSRNGVREMQQRFKRSKSELEALSGEQKSIREGKRQVKEKFEAIESECEELKRETRFIIQQNARTQVKLTLMLGILKARETGDLTTAASLTRMLREIVRREKEEREADS